MMPCFAEHDIAVNRILTERGTEYRSVPAVRLLATLSVGRTAGRAAHGHQLVSPMPAAARAQNQLGLFSRG
jgi:hypothetical protein